MPHVQSRFQALFESVMTPESLISNYLSLRVWLYRIVLPTMLCLLAVLYILGTHAEAEINKDHMATIIGFFAFYFVLVRGGHMIMIRSLHMDLMKKHEAAYRYELSAVAPILFRRKSIGFALAQIKRRILEDAKRPNHRHSQKEPHL